MSYGKGYDSDEGRGLAGSITSLMTGTAYEVSAEIAAATAPFPGYLDARCNGIDKPLAPDNVAPMLEVIERHLKACADIDSTAPTSIRIAAVKAWESALAKGRQHGYRNAQVTVLAPTGTIGFLMDCDTTGIEPDIALVKYKLLAGGGMLKIVNQTVPGALKELGYSGNQVSDIIDYIDKHDTIEGAPHLKDAHVSVFDCAFKPANGTRSLQYRAHIRMMAAAQPFLSGAISKTVNLPNTATVEDIMQTYIESWKLGLKAVAIYRDGSKRSAPLNVKKTKDMGTEDKAIEAVAAPKPLPVEPAKPTRRRMSDTRISITHKFDIAGHEGYLTVGLFDDKQPGELFITMAKEGSTIGGLMDTIGTLVSLALQYGVPVDAMVKKFAHTRFEPSGFTKNPDIRNAKSIPDYIFRWMGNQFILGYREANNPNAGQQELPIKEIEELEKKTLNKPVAELPVSEDAAIAITHTRISHTETDTSELIIRFRDGLTCPECGSSKIKHTGSCATCLNCGASLGCS